MDAFYRRQLHCRFTIGSFSYLPIGCNCLYCSCEQLSEYGVVVDKQHGQFAGEFSMFFARSFRCFLKEQITIRDAFHFVVYRSRRIVINFKGCHSQINHKSTSWSARDARVVAFIEPDVSAQYFNEVLTQK